MELLKGRVFEKIKGLYKVKSGEVFYNCRLKGTLKIKDAKENCVTGDFVTFDPENLLIVKVEERKNLITRPLVANIDKLIIQFAAKDPVIDYDRLEVLLLNAFHHKIQPIVIVNKIDLISELDQKELETNLAYLNDLSVDCFLISTYEEIGLDKLKEALATDELFVFSGPSGVGKSSILNMCQNIKELEVGETSRKLKRGKHTTRTATLIKIPQGGYLVDTPGFSSVDLPPVKNELELFGLYPDLKQEKKCHFNDCIHIKEPKCAVKEAVDNCRINKKRYESYLKNCERLLERRY